MTILNMTCFCERLLQKCNGDFLLAQNTLEASADSWMALGDWEKAQKIAKILNFFIKNYN